MRRFTVTVLAFLLTGCMIGPDYRRPAVDVMPSYRFEEKDTRDTANTDWWKAFQDPVLDSLIAEALANNKNVKVAAANMDQAAGVLMQTRAPLFPQLNYSGTGKRQRVSDASAVSLPHPDSKCSQSLEHCSNLYPVPAGRSICGDASEGSPSLHGQTCWPVRRLDGV